MSDFLNQFAANTSGLPGTYKELAALARDRNEARMAACEFGQTVGAATGFELDLQSGQLELIFAGREVAVVSAQVAGTLGDEGMFMWGLGAPLGAIADADRRLGRAGVCQRQPDRATAEPHCRGHTQTGAGFCGDHRAFVGRGTEPSWGHLAAVRFTLLTTLTTRQRRDDPVTVYFIGAGPGDPDLITVKGKGGDRTLRAVPLRRFAGARGGGGLCACRGGLCGIRR